MESGKTMKNVNEISSHSANPKLKTNKQTKKNTGLTNTKETTTIEAAAAAGRERKKRHFLFKHSSNADVEIGDALFSSSKIFCMRITTTSSFFFKWSCSLILSPACTYMRWEWILFAAFISLSLAHQLWFVDELRVYFVCIASDEQWTCATWSLSISSSSTHSLHFTPSLHSAPYHCTAQHSTVQPAFANLSSCIRCVYVFESIHFAHSSRKTYQRRVKRANHVTNLVFPIFST